VPDEESGLWPRGACKTERLHDPGHQPLRTDYRAVQPPQSAVGDGVTAGFRLNGAPFCSSQPGFDRAAIHREFNAAVVGVLQRCAEALSLARSPSEPPARFLAGAPGKRLGAGVDFAVFRFSSISTATAPLDLVSPCAGGLCAGEHDIGTVEPPWCGSEQTLMPLGADICLRFPHAL